MRKTVKAILADPRLAGPVAFVKVARRAAELVRSARQKAGMTQDDLSAALGVTQPYVSQIESGKVSTMPSLATLATAMTACGDELHLGTAGEWRALEARIAELEARLEKRTQLEFEAVGGRNTPRITVTKAGTDVVLEWETAGARNFVEAARVAIGQVPKASRTHAGTIRVTLDEAMPAAAAMAAPAKAHE